MLPSTTPIFICYAHRDNDALNHQGRWLDRLLEHLSPLADEESIEAWSDKQIEIGDEWDATIKERLQKARVGILLISPAFMASKYIRNSELPILLQKSKEQGLTIISILISPCAFDQATFKFPDPKTGPQELKLSIFQAANSLSHTLKDCSEAEQDRILDSVARRVGRLIEDPR